jgi:hypothetical protein
MDVGTHLHRKDHKTKLFVCSNVVGSSVIRPSDVYILVKSKQQQHKEIVKMPRKSFLQTITKSPSKHRVAVNNDASNIESREDIDASSIRRKTVTRQMHQISDDQYRRGVAFLQQHDLDNARECFEDALGKRRC